MSRNRIHLGTIRGGALSTLAMRLAARLLLVLMLVTLPAHVATGALDLPTRHAVDRASNPADAQLVLSASQRAYRIGERIPITLAFSSNAREKYVAEASTYDRSGRQQLEEWIAAGTGWVDPFADYFRTGVMGGIAGGPRSRAVLENTPLQVELTLNERLRFDRPGVYRLYVKSHRVSRERNAGEAGEGRLVSVAITSNVLEVEVTAADAAWEQAMLAAIGQALANPAEEDPANRARIELRYLATPDAVGMELDFCRRTRQSPDTLLLVGARDRQQMLAAYDDFLAEPQTTITRWDIRLRALFRYVEEERPQLLPATFWELQDNPRAAARLERAAFTRWNRFEARVQAEALRLIPVALRKSGDARHGSGMSIAALARTPAEQAGLVPPQDDGLSRAALIAGLATFPKERQLALLTGQWDRIRGPEVLVPLRTMVGDTGHDLAEEALARLLELAPDEARAVVRHDIATGTLRFANFAVRMLDAFEIPEADPVFAAWVAGRAPGRFDVLAKFATARFAPDIRRILESKGWPCLQEEPMVAYLVRVLPAKQAGEVLRHAMQDRAWRRCYPTLLPAVAAVVWNPVVQAQAIASLDDDDPETASTAATQLAWHAGPEVEPLLWQKLEQWSSQWRGRAAELLPNPITGKRIPTKGIGNASLITSLTSARDWPFDEPRRQRLLALCIDEHCRQQWARPLAVRRVEVWRGDGQSRGRYAVGGYAADKPEAVEAKLLQYPSGSVFRWCAPPAEPGGWFTNGQRDELFQRFQRFARGRGLRLQPYDGDKCMPSAAD